MSKSLPPRGFSPCRTQLCGHWGWRGDVSPPAPPRVPRSGEGQPGAELGGHPEAAPTVVVSWPQCWERSLGRNLAEALHQGLAAAPCPTEEFWVLLLCHILHSWA